MDIRIFKLISGEMAIGTLDSADQVFLVAGALTPASKTDLRHMASFKIINPAILLLSRAWQLFLCCLGRRLTLKGI